MVEVSDVLEWDDFDTVGCFLLAEWEFRLLAWDSVFRVGEGVSFGVDVGTVS